ncbi:MAG: outer membrane beta-barrel protein [Bacteroidota bacterium]
MKTLLLFLCLLTTTTTFGQFNLSGKILDTNHEPLEFVNILLLSAEDEEMAAGEITNSDGQFLIENLEPGNYTLQASFIGFAPLEQEIVLNASTELSPIILKTIDNMLDEVAITAKKPVFERKSDRTIVNVQNAITSAGNDALQILERSPGVQVDRANNALSLMGKNGVVVAINGKRSRLDQQALIQMLASTPSSNIKSIELITNPPASYDAQGDAGVINIIMIKNENDGFNGNVNLFAGMARRAKFGGGANFNLNRGKINLYGDFSSNNDYADHDVTIIQQIQYANQFIDTEQNNFRPNYTGNHSGKLGLDLQITDGIDFGFFVAGSKRDWKLDAVSTTDYNTSIQGLAREELTSFESNETDHYMISNHLGIALTEQSKLSFDYDYLNYKISNPTDYQLLQKDVAGKMMTESNFLSDKYTPFDFHVLKADYESKIWDKFDFQAGAKLTLSDVSNDTRLTYLPGNINDPFFTDLIEMDEQILAGYTSLKGSLTESINFTAGIRYEDYRVDLTSSKDGNLIDRNRGRFYPTVSINHRFTESRFISFSYNERVNRPGFQVLAPAFYFFDVNTVLGGNVKALPTISRTLGANLNLGTLFISFSYSDEDDPISWGQPELNDDTNILILAPQNTPDRDVMSLTMSFPVQITSFWSTQWNMNFFHRKETAYLEGNIVTDKSLAAFGNLTQTFTLPSNWEAEFSTRWNSSFQLALASFKPRISSNIGLQKKFANGSRLSFNWNDIFNLGSFFGVINDNAASGIYYDFNYEMEGNVVRVAYNIPFGNTGLKVRNKHTSGSAEEQQRAQN